MKFPIFGNHIFDKLLECLEKMNITSKCRIFDNQIYKLKLFNRTMNLHRVSYILNDNMKRRP